MLHVIYQSPNEQDPVLVWLSPSVDVHREDGPARCEVNENGYATETWACGGLAHRAGGGPATWVRYATGACNLRWVKEGWTDRADGPASVQFAGAMAWTCRSDPAFDVRVDTAPGAAAWAYLMDSNTWPERVDPPMGFEDFTFDIGAHTP